MPGVWAIWSGFATGVFSSDAVGTDGFSGFVVMLSFALGALWLWLWLRAKERRPFASLGFERQRGRSWLALAARGFGVGIVMIAVCVLVPVSLGQARLEWANPNGTSVALVAGMLLGFLVQGSTERSSPAPTSPRWSPGAGGSSWPSSYKRCSSRWRTA